MYTTQTDDARVRRMAADRRVEAARKRDRNRAKIAHVAMSFAHAAPNR